MCDRSVAVVIPLYNHARYIGSALDSVLNQTCRPTQIVVVDDGSSDHGVSICRAKLDGVDGARVLTQPNAGAHHALNRAIEATTSELVAVLNSDDIFELDKLERCVGMFAQQPDLSLVFGRLTIIDENDATVTAGPTVDWLARSIAFARGAGTDIGLISENFATTTSNMMFRKETWTANGGFMPLRYCHDLEFILSALGRGKVLFDQDRIHTKYRVHPTNTIKQRIDNVRVEIAGVLANALFENSPGFAAEFNRSRIIALFQALSGKGLSDLICTLLPLRSATAKMTFFETITSQQGLETLHHLAAPGSATQLLKSQSWALAAKTFAATSKLSAEGSLDINALIEVSSFDKGGLEKVVLDSAILLKELGVKPLIVSCRAAGHLAEVAKAAEVEVVSLPETNTLEAYRSLVAGRRIDISMSHFSRLGYPIFRERGIPNVTFIHNVYAMLDVAGVAAFKADDAYVDRYISVSRKATEYAVGPLGIKPAKIETIPNGLIIEEHLRREAQAVPVQRERFGLSDDDYVFLNVASYNLHKGHYLMADAMNLILNLRSDVKILCIGNVIYPPHIEQLTRFLDDAGLSRHIIMPGYFEDVTPLLQMADAFLLPSFLEGWSIAMNEAMFHGKPMILSDTGGSRDVIEENDIGLIVANEYGEVTNLNSPRLNELAYSRRKYETAPKLARAMLEFADNREHWAEAGRRGRAKIFEKYRFEKIVGQYVDVLKGVIKR
ncbi:glycosyltransferase [Rhodopseudomonas sp. HC1]|uniref:glycosyltransferase n=1 Tax=Rhodopseudomonas infernalis TaxID=2897386 RepID=UPI001EE80734|nr:glycosyltransferase [Rhodopseudomonas infernalis]MCG6205037.1 glycosyltransferase [Rhodopseudomonas infernalis]